MSSPTPVIPGFSLTNRWLLYTSLMISPAQALSGFGSHCLSNLGFLAFNYYQQYIWLSAARERQLHALSLLPFHLNIIYGVTYLAGVPSGNYVLLVVQALATVGLLILNNVAAWVSYKRDLAAGLGTYEFFFFGWRTLSPKWMRFFLLWGIGDTLLAVAAIFAVLGITAYMMAQTKMGFSPFKSLSGLGRRRSKSKHEKDAEGGEEGKATEPRIGILVAGPVMALACTWPLILWVELIVKRNRIVSETDMVSVYLFITQAALLVVSIIVNCFSAASD